MINRSFIRIFIGKEVLLINRRLVRIFIGKEILLINRIVVGMNDMKEVIYFYLLNIYILVYLVFYKYRF